MRTQKQTKNSIGLQKAPTGIEGFDEISGGGLPRSRTTLLIGGPGTGKTVFALQTLVNGARQWGEPGIFVAFEENSRQILANAASFGWDLPSLTKISKPFDKRRAGPAQGSPFLFFLDAHLSPAVVQAGRFDLSGMLAAIQAKAAEMGARRIVFDSVDVLLALLDNPVAERQEIYRLHEWLSQSELTGIITAKMESGDALNSYRYGFMQFMADCVVLLRQEVAAHVSRRELRVVKYRGSTCVANECPLIITSEGSAVSSPAMGELAYAVSTERVSTGIERLDTMLAGGYYRGTSTLITGAPGTAKSTLSGAFTEAACRRGERTLYACFDEGASQVVKNLSSVGIHLEPYLKSGVLRMWATHAETKSPEEHFVALNALIRAYQPRCLVVDPLSAMVKVGGELISTDIAQRLLNLTRTEGISAVFTSLLETNDATAEAASIQISTIADTWIHLSYVVRGGERNRALTIVKSRGTKHSNQVRELILSDEGVTLTDVYSAGGEVLMGTARWEKENAEATEREQIRAEVERKRHELELAEAEANVRLESIKHDLALLESQQKARERQWSERRSELLDQRGVDVQRDESAAQTKQTSTQKNRKRKEGRA